MNFRLQIFTYYSKSHKFSGAQFGIYYGRAEYFSGLQNSLVNYAENMEGVQIGLVNITENLSGLQIGAVNIIKESKLIPFMFGINFSWKILQN